MARAPDEAERHEEGEGGNESVHRAAGLSGEGPKQGYDGAIMDGTCVQEGEARKGAGFLGSRPCLR